jgi:hypothetical protein
MLTDEQIRKHVETIVKAAAPQAKTAEEERLIEAGAALFTSFMIALHTNARGK